MGWVEVMKTITISNNINYKEIKESAYDFLDKYSNGRLPINLLDIINKIDNLHLMKYTRFAHDRKLKLKEVCELLQSEDGALWYQTVTDTYILLYNDTVTNKERIRFTIAHELGHYVLKHNEKTEKTILSRYNLTEDEYNTFEKEANFFAKHLLVPFPVLGNYNMFFHRMDARFIRTVFQVSYSVASYVIDNLRSMSSFGLVKDGHNVECRFAKYIDTSQSTRICQTCYSKINRKSNYCHICSAEQHKGSSTLDAYLDNREREEERMRYYKYALDEDGFPNSCPRCENEELNGCIFCNVCGIYIRNICLGDCGDNYDAWGHLIPIQDQLEKGCGKSLAGNSRYCPDCGGKSSYFFQGLLKNWDIEKKESEELPF